MNRWIKVISTTIVGSVLLLILVVVLLVAFVSPNNLKPIIEQQVYKMTGRTLVLHGDIHWTFFPSIGLKVTQAEFGNAKNFDSKQFAIVNQAKVSVKLLPLFRAKVDVDELMVDGVTLNLMKNQAGETNWMDLIATKPHVENAVEKEHKHIFDFNFPQLDIKNVTINWQDLGTGQEVKISNLNGRATHIQSNTPFPIKLSMEINNVTPRMQGQVVLVSKLQVQPRREHYQLSDLRLNVRLRGSTLPNGILNADLRGNVDVMSKQLKAEPLRLVLNDSHTTGNIDITDLSKLVGQFSITTDHFNLDQWISQSKQKSTPSKKSMRRDTNVLTNVLQKFNMRGKIRIGQLVVLGMRAKQIHASINTFGGILTFSPISAELYEGGFSGLTTFNLKQAIPVLRIKGNFKNVAVQPLLQDLKGYQKISGIGNLKIDFTARGDGAFIKTLNGSMSFEVKNGLLHGIDILYLMQVGKSVIFEKQMPPLPTGPAQTNFGDLIGTASIRNGIIYNNDLRLISKEFEGEGKGTINLIMQQMDYDINVNPVSNKELIIPLEIKGPFTDLKKGVDMKRLLLKATKWQLEKRTKGIIEREEEMRHFIGEKIKSTVKGLVNGTKNKMDLNWKHFFHDQYDLYKTKLFAGIDWVKELF